LPPDRKVPLRATPVLEAVAGWIDEMLAEDLAAPRKQRHSAGRVFEWLVMSTTRGCRIRMRPTTWRAAPRSPQRTAGRARALTASVQQAREKIATIAIARKMLTRAWHLLADMQAVGPATPPRP
jgi:hypothetical protein